MTFWELILYSLVQGITEFLPISSSGHLIILESILEWPIPGRTMAIAAHLGSLLAVLLYLKNDFILCFTNDLKKNNIIVLIRNLIIITIPVVIIGFLIFKVYDDKLLTLNIKKQKILILATITKTGTHYVRFLLAYYLKMLSLKKS